MAQTPLNPSDAASALEPQIAFVLQHPGMSDWLKRALLDALDRPPIEVLNDLEILNRLLRSRAEAMLSEACKPGVATVVSDSRADVARHRGADAELSSG